MSIYGSKHVEECNIIWINNNLYIKSVIMYSYIMMHGQKNIKLCHVCLYIVFIGVSN